MKASLGSRILYSAWARPILLIALLLVIWELVIVVFRIPPYLIPAPLDVVKQLVLEWPKLFRESLMTTYATLGGFGLSALFVGMEQTAAETRTESRSPIGTDLARLLVLLALAYGALSFFENG